MFFDNREEAKETLKLVHQFLEFKCCRIHHQIDAISHTFLEIISCQAVLVSLDVKEWAKLQESLLKSQFTVIREFLKQGEEPTFKPRKTGRSQMSIIYDARDEFHVDLDRESVVSAMTKQAKRPRMFERVGPNTCSIVQPASEKNQ
jgi:hypothetical protein